MKKMISTPAGTEDLLYGDCLARRSVEDRVCGLFANWGYSEVMTPEVEYYDLITRTGNPLPQESMLKIIDRSGSILVMRPDNTSPMARVAATKLRSMPLPLRLYYNQTVFRSDPAHRGRRGEIAQCGLELIGSKGLRADLEVILLAIKSLEASGLSDFYIELGHVGFFKSLIAGLEADAEVKERVRRLIEGKGFAALSKLLKPYMQSETAAALSRISRLFGGPEVLDEALELVGGSAAREAAFYLKELYAELEAAGYGERVRFDLGLVHQLDYYTGLVFRGYAEGFGSSILAGGRYDTLIGKIGGQTPATGFALDTLAVCDCLPKAETMAVEELVYYDRGCLKAAAAYMDEAGGGARLASRDSLEGSAEEAISCGISWLRVFSDQGERLVEL